MTNDQIIDLKRLVKQNSFTGNKGGVNAVGHMIKQLLSEYNLDWTEHEHEYRGSLFCAKTKQWDDRLPVILLSGHMDTVFPDNWPLQIDGNIFRGPGSMDMKAGLLVVVETIRQLAASNQLQNIIILLTPDEEDGMVHIEQQQKYYKQADYALVFEEGTWDREKVSSDERAVVVKRKALSFYDITLHGPGGHNANLTQPDERHSVIHQLARKITALEHLNDYATGTLVNVGIIEGGVSPNSIAQSAKMRVDIRFGNRSEVDRIETALATEIFISTNPNITIETERTLHYPSFDTNAATDEFADVVCATGAKLGMSMHRQQRSAGSEANWISHLNPNCAVIDGFGVIGNGDHSTNEYFLIDSFHKSVQLATNTIVNIFGHAK